MGSLCTMQLIWPHVGPKLWICREKHISSKITQSLWVNPKEQIILPVSPLYCTRIKRNLIFNKLTTCTQNQLPSAHCLFAKCGGLSASSASLKQNPEAHWAFPRQAAPWGSKEKAVPARKSVTVRSVYLSILFWQWILKREGRPLYMDRFFGMHVKVQVGQFLLKLPRSRKPPNIVRGGLVLAMHRRV